MKFDRKKENIKKMKSRVKGIYKGKAGYTTKTGGSNLKGLFSEETEDGIKLSNISKELKGSIDELD